MAWQKPEIAENRRRCIRLRETGAARACIRFVRWAESEVRLKPGLIRLIDVSPGGCGFHSGLRLPLDPRFLYRLDWEADGELFRVHGRLRWRMPDENGYRYGAAFELGQADRKRLCCALNRRVLRLCPGQFKIHGLYRSQLAAERANHYVSEQNTPID